MAFRKRNVGIQRAPAGNSPAGNADLSSRIADQATESLVPITGVRPSPLTGQPTTSTGAYSLDSILGGHAGLALGSSLLIEESGTTDFAGALVRYYAAEGITQGHTVHIVGVGDQWVKDLPALVGASDGSDALDLKKVKVDEEKMKIAWRYERLGQVDSDRAGRGALIVLSLCSVHEYHPDWFPVIPGRAPPVSSSNDEVPQSTAFCHVFDLAKRLTVPPNVSINHINLQPNNSPSISPFDAILQDLSQKLKSSPSNVAHRLVIPTILSPAIYPPHAGHPHHFLKFLHSLRSLLRQFPTRLSAIITLPLELYHRSSGNVRWAETLSDGVIELTPFPHLMDASNSLAESGGARGLDEQPQGMLKIHKLPVTTDRGGGGTGSGVGDDLAFTVSRRKFVIKPFSLPPMEGDTEAQNGQAEGGALGKATKVDIEF